MALVGFGLANLAKAANTNVGRCTLDDRGAFLTDRVGERSNAPQGVAGWYDVHNGNGSISIDGTPYTVANGLYEAPTLASRITSAVVGGGGPADFACDFNVLNQFRLRRTGGTPFTVDFSGLANSIAATIGYADANLSGSSLYLSAEPRPSGSVSVVEIDLNTLSPSGSSPDPGGAFVVLYGDDDTDFSDVKVFLAANSLASSSQPWRTLGETLTLSDRGTRTDAAGVLINPLQGALRTTGTPRRYMRFQWDHADTSTVHAVGVIYLCDWTQDDTRTAREIPYHIPTPQDDGADSLYPSEGLKRWTVRLPFDRWGPSAAAVLDALHDTGGARLMVWALRGDEVKAGARTLGDEADAGYAYFGRLRLGPRSYSGGGSDFVSEEHEIVQEV